VDRAFEVLLEKIREDLNARREVLLQGGVTSFEQYRELTGVIRGLALAEQHINDLARLMEDNDD
jgi:hypothetical protein